jgi:hypothetical protein
LLKIIYVNPTMRAALDRSAKLAELEANNRASFLRTIAAALGFVSARGRAQAARLKLVPVQEEEERLRPQLTEQQVAERHSLPGAIPAPSFGQGARVRSLSAAGTTPLSNDQRGANVSAAGPGAAGGAGSNTMRQQEQDPIALVRATAGLQGSPP